MRRALTIGLCVFLVLFAGMSSAAEVTIFGPKTYVRTTGTANVYTDSFTALFPDIVSTGKLVIENGDSEDKHRVTSGLIFVNGVQIFGPKDFKQNTYLMEAPVDLTDINTLELELRSKPDTYLKIWIIQDFDPPTVTISAEPDAIKVNENSTLTWSSTLADTCSIAPDISSVPVDGSTTVSPDINTTYTITASGPGGVSTGFTTITHVNTAPTAQDQVAITDEDMGVAILLVAADIDNDPLVYQIVTPPVLGTLTGQVPDLTYDPDEDYYGSDSFTFKANDGLEDSNIATVSLTINPVNDQPVALDDTASTDEDTPTTTGNVLANDSDVDGDILSVVGFTQASNGTVADNGDGTFTYSPDQDYNGTDSFTYTASDGNRGTDIGTVTITVNPINDPPTADAGLDQTVFRTDTVMLDGNGSSDVDGDSLSYQWSFLAVTTGSTATLSDPSLANPFFVPDVSGAYEVELIVNDGTVDSNPDTVVITAEPRIVQVPDVAGMAQVDAESAILAADLTVGSVTEQHSDTVPAGHVISQDPVAGASIEEFSPVDLIVSLSSSLPTISINADPTPIMIGESSTLSWTSSNAQSAFIDNSVGVVPVDGSTTVSPENSTTYTISVRGPTGFSSAQTTVTVLGFPEPQPEGSFGEQYEDLIPPDATVDQYDSKRFSLISGLVLAMDGSPVSDVYITIFNNPQYGTVLTDATGQFFIPVEGGGTMTVVYQKAGLISAQRKVYVPWNDIAIAKTIHMISEDPISTIVTFDGNPDTVVAHQSTEVTDEFGARSATLVFTGDNQAYLLDENGNDIHELTTITTRVTEFTTPDSMPAILPPNSAYTYCVELSADGAQRVRFDKPVIMWVDNFLGFDVGEIVPVGYYDRDRGVWVPSDNGVVVKLLDIDADGIVDAMDADGDDQPDDLDNDGLFINEVTGLDDPARYIPTSTFWRVAVAHFSPLDCNWPSSPPPDSTPPNPEEVPELDQQKKDCPSPGCVVEARSRIIHDDIPIPGTDMTLHYASHRVEGYKTAITVPASGETVPDSLKSIIVKVEIAGRILEQTLSPLPNQRAEFIWNGLDQFGGHVTVPIAAHVSIGFVYDAVFLSPGDFAQAFGQAGDAWTGITARQEVIFWKRSSITSYPPKAKVKAHIADGWTISSNHHLNPVDPSELYKGDGTTSRNNARMIVTIAGTGSSGYTGDGGTATLAQLYQPSGISVDTNSNIYIADTYNHCVRKVDTNGIITTVAGTGSYGYSGDGGPATLAQLYRPYGIAVDTNSNLYIADTYNHCVRKVDANGIITTVAGTGSYGAYDYSGHGGPATLADLGFPYDVAVDTQGNLYIDDRNSHSIRKVDQNGIITTVVSRESAGCYLPYGVAVDGEGNIYIADPHTSYIKKVDQNGITTTIAGNGVKGYGGDGGPATLASLNFPRYIALDTDGKLYICDYGNNRIRQVDTQGFITTVAGIGSSGYIGDGGPATSAELNYPSTVDADTEGNLYITDSFNHCIRKVVVPSDFATLTSAGEILFAEENGLGHIMSSGAGRHLRTIDVDTGVVLFEFGYDVDNKLVSITDQFGNQTTMQRDANGVPVAIISPDGITTILTIDGNNHLTKITYPDGSYYDFEYTQDGLMTAKVEPEGNRFEHVFDSNGRLTDATDEEGGQWNYTRTADEYGDILTEVLTGEGNLTSYLDHTYSTGAYVSTITGPTGAQTLFSQLADGLTVNKSLPCGMDFEFKYGVDSQYKFKVVKEIRERTPSALEKLTLRDKTYVDTNSDDIPDLITETVTVNDKPTTLENNVLQAKKTVTSPEGRPVTTLYDPLTLLSESLSISGLYDTTYVYDPRGRLTSIVTNTRETSFTYDAQGFLESVTDPEDFMTSYTYDAMGRMRWIDRPDGTSIGFDYDSNGNMTVLTNPSSVDHGSGYNLVNKNSSYQTPLSGNYSYLYDKDRRLIRTTFPSGAQIKNIYNTTQLSQIQTPEGNIDYTYLCSTKVDSVTNGTDTITYGYDGKLVTSETLSGTLNESLAYTYDNDFNLSSFTYAGSTTSYSYDNDGLLTGAAGFTISRNAANGLPESVTDGTLNLDRTFNGYGEVESQDFSVSSQSLTSWDLIRDDNGRITQKTETVDGVTSNYLYTYDSMGRLTTVTKDGGLVEEYEYTLNGTRTYEMNTLRGLSGRTLTYSDEDHLLTAGTLSYEYDLDGFLTTKTDGADVTTYDYSSLGELLSVTLPDGTSIEYVHDPLGRRIAKKLNGITMEKYLWHGLTRLLAVYDGNNNLLMRFEYADGRMPVSMMRSDGTYYFTYDQVGSLRVVANATGTALKIIDYDSFGNIINDTDPSFAVPFGFAGGLYDPDTGLIRFGYRDYNPDVGRWIAKDPILFAGGSPDLYGYCLNDPINCVDPSGLSFLGSAAGYALAALGGITSGGPGALIGGAVGGVIGAAFGGLPGAIIVGAFGSMLGSLFDPVSSGQLNYLEDLELEHMRNMQEWEEIDKRVQDLLDEVTDLNNRMGGPLDDEPCQ